MDSKNVIAAISLSAAVIILYSLFFAPTPKEIKKVNNENIKKEQSSDTPLLEENENLPKLSREDALNENKRFNFENENIKGTARWTVFRQRLALMLVVVRILVMLIQEIGLSTKLM